MISLLSEHTLGMISIILHCYGSGYGLFWGMCYGYLKRVCNLMLGGVLNMSIRSCWLTVLFSCSLSLVIFYLVVLSVAERGVEVPYCKCVFVGKIPWRRAWQATPLPGESHGQRSLVSYSPWVCKESDTTEQLTL